MAARRGCSTPAWEPQGRSRWLFKPVSEALEIAARACLCTYRSRWWFESASEPRGLSKWLGCRRAQNGCSSPPRSHSGVQKLCSKLLLGTVVSFRLFSESLYSVPLCFHAQVRATRIFHPYCKRYMIQDEHPLTLEVKPKWLQSAIDVKPKLIRIVPPPSPKPPIRL